MVWEGYLEGVGMLPEGVRRLSRKCGEAVWRVLKVV